MTTTTDDFQELPPRARKPTTKTTKPSKKPTKTTTRRVEESTKDADANDETLSLFQRIVGPDFEIRASEEFERGSERQMRKSGRSGWFQGNYEDAGVGIKEGSEEGREH